MSEAQVGRVGVLGLLDLGVGDGREVAEHLGGVGLGGARVAADGLGLGGDAGEVLGALADLQGLLGRGLVGDGDRLVRRAVPAGLGVLASHSRTFCMTSLGLMPRTPASLVRTALPSSFCFQQVGAGGGDHQAGSRCPRGSTPRASRMSPRTAGSTTCWTWLPDASLLVLGALTDLQVPQPAAERAEKGRAPGSGSRRAGSGRVGSDRSRGCWSLRLSPLSVCECAGRGSAYE